MKHLVDKNRGFWRAFNPYLMPGKLQIRFDPSPSFVAGIAGPAFSLIWFSPDGKRRIE